MTDYLSIQAIQLDPAFAKNIGQIVLLGGAFAVNGNVNPAAEANVSRLICIRFIIHRHFYSTFLYLAGY